VKIYTYVKAKIKEELLDNCRPTKIKGTLVRLTLKTEGGGANDDELIDGLSRIRI